MIQIASHAHSAPAPAIEIIDGELVEDYHCPRCGGRHPIAGGHPGIDSPGYIQCCCGEHHEADYCCECGHYHDGSACPARCGDYRCCLP